MTYLPLRPDSKRVEAALVITHDLTEHMLASEALLQTQVELARMNRVTTLGSLAASIAHEINQPLAAIVTDGSAGLRWLNSESPDLVEARQTLTRVIKDANRAAEVIGRVRALATKSPIQCDQLDINDVIREVIALTRGERDRNRVALHTELADDLPMIQGDRVQLQQVILNLIMNGVEAMSGGEPRELLIGSRKDESLNVLVSVCDTGPGLAPECIDRIFDAFYTTKAGGIGMGLSICRSIIETHGGRLWTSANSPRGASFHFSLPADRVDAQAA
jgi:C4-dicarboxylate-specific signal transduction histidine kinase